MRIVIRVGFAVRSSAETDPAAWLTCGEEAASSSEKENKLRAVEAVAARLKSCNESVFST